MAGSGSPNVFKIHPETGELLSSDALEFLSTALTARSLVIDSSGTAIVAGYRHPSSGIGTIGIISSAWEDRNFNSIRKLNRPLLFNNGGNPYLGALYGSGTITLTYASQTAMVESNVGVTTVNLFPGFTPFPAVQDAVVVVVDIGENAATNNITVYGNGFTVEDPNTPGTFSSSVIIQTNGQAVSWIFDGQNNRYKLLSVAISSSSGGGAKENLATVQNQLSYQDEIWNPNVGGGTSASPANIYTGSAVLNSTDGQYNLSYVIDPGSGQVAGADICVLGNALFIGASTGSNGIIHVVDLGGGTRILSGEYTFSDANLPNTIAGLRTLGNGNFEDGIFAVTDTQAVIIWYGNYWYNGGGPIYSHSGTWTGGRGIIIRGSAATPNQVWAVWTDPSTSTIWSIRANVNLSSPAPQAAATGITLSGPICLDRSSKEVYVAGGTTVSSYHVNGFPSPFHGCTLALDKQFTVPGTITDLVSDGVYLWVLSSATNSIYKCDPVAGTVVSTIFSVGIVSTSRIYYDGNKIYVTPVSANNVVVVIPPESSGDFSQVTVNYASFFAGPAPAIRGIAFDTSSGDMYAVQGSPYVGWVTRIQRNESKIDRDSRFGIFKFDGSQNLQSGSYARVGARMVEYTGYSSPSTFILPNYASDGTRILFKDVDGNAFTNPLTINGATIDGLSSYVLNDGYGFVEMTCKNRTWRVVRKSDYSKLLGLGINEYNAVSGGKIAEILPTETKLGYGTTQQVDAFTVSLTTTNSSGHTIATITVPTTNPWKQLIDVHLTVMGIDQNATSLGTIGFYRADYLFSVLYDSTSATVQIYTPISITNPANLNTQGTATTNSWATNLNAIGNTVQLNLNGDPSHTVAWTCIGQIQRGQ